MNKILAIVIVVAAFLASGFLSYSYFNNTALKASLSSYKPPVMDNNGTVPTESNEPKTEQCLLNGEMITKSQKAAADKRRPLGIMVENHLDARPQSGLSFSDVVYEAVAEGGITRFLSVYYCKDAPYVGPIRSARVYYIDLISGYGAYPLYTHVGGANCNKTTGSGCDNGAPADALGTLDKLGWVGYNDMNFIPFPYMWRNYERLPGVATEHTVYSTTQKLYDYAAKERDLTDVDDKGVKWDKDFVPWKFKDDQPSSSPTAAKITFEFWSKTPDYAVEWDYNKATNSYSRLNGGKPHIDKDTNKQLTAKNVLIAFAKETEVNDGYDLGQHMLYKVVGSNDAIVFMDGKVVKGTWKKTTSEDQMRFYDSAGNEIKLNRGKDWIEIVPEGNTITY
jgi:hypothetical protein